MMRRWCSGWLISLTLAVGAVSCESPPETRSAKSAPDKRTEKNQLSGGAFEYAHSVGERGAKPGRLDEPIGLAVDGGGDLYVSEGGNDRLQKLTPDGESLAVWAEGIGRPMHVTLDDDGRLVVPAYSEDLVHIYDGPDDEVDRFGGEWVDGPAGVAVGPQGRYYVADFYHHRFHIVGEDGTVEKTVGKKGKESGQFTYPTDLDVTSDGDIWVADAYAHRIQVFGPDGTHKKTIGEKGTDRAGRFHVATGIDRGPEGNLYVADFKNDRVQVLRPDGEPVAVIDGADEGDGSMTHPIEVVATAEALFVVDHGHHQIDVYERKED